MKFIKILITFSFIFTFASCKEEIVARNLDQKQANEIVSVFSKFKISSKVTKDANSKKLLMVKVDRDDYEEAASILTQKGLPKDKGSTFADVISHHGILPDSKRMEDLRLDKALALEIEESLSKMNEFSNVSVVVRKEYLGNLSNPLVSVLLVKNVSDSVVNYDNVYNIIQTAIPGIAKRDIKLVIEVKNDEGFLNENYTKSLDGKNSRLIKLEKFLGKFNVSKDDYVRLSMFYISSLFIAFSLGVMAVFGGIKFKNYRKEKSKIFEVTSKDLLGKNIVKKG